MKKVLILIFILLVAEIGLAQDPGIPDTVRFGKWGVYLPCPPCSGVATVPIYTFNDESLIQMVFYFQAIGDIEFKDVGFTPKADSHFDLQSIFFYTPSKTSIGLISSWNYPDFPPGLTNIGYLILDVKDTGIATIDTFRPNIPPDAPIRFWSSNDESIKPIFVPTNFYLTAQPIRAGDTNDDGKVNLGDIVYLVNYIFKNGPEPENKQMADVNVDCIINLSDLLYLVNFIFKSGPEPLPGCS